MAQRFYLPNLLSNLEPEVKQILSKYLENCKMFFVDENIIDFYEETPNTGDLELQNLDLPFECCWFQCTNNRPLIGEGFTIKDGFQNVEVQQLWMGLLVIESKPQEYMYFPYVENYKEHDYSKIVYNGLPTEDKITLRTANNIVMDILKKLKNANNTIFVNENYQFKLKKEGQKKINKIKEVIYITSDIKKISSVNKSNIVKKCGYRFDVRGHWRVVNGMGKNRQGEYCINNYTWVRPCVKGDESLPHISKIRVIK